MRELKKFAVGLVAYGALLLVCVLTMCIVYSSYTGQPVVINSVTFFIALVSGSVAREISDAIEQRIFGEDTDEETEIEKG